MQAFAIIRVGCLQRSVFKYIRRRIVQILLTKIVLNGSFRDFYHQIMVCIQIILQKVGRVTRSSSKVSFLSKFFLNKYNFTIEVTLLLDRFVS